VKFPIQQDLDLQAFADEFGDDVDLSGPLVDLSGVESEATTPEKEAETSTEIPDTDEPEQEAVESTPEQAEEVVEVPETFQFEYNGKPYEITVDQIVELNNGYLRQEDYTRKLQWFGNWYQQHQSQVNFVNNLDKLFELRPDKAKVFYEQIINDVPATQTQVAQQSEKTVQELLNEQQQTPQASQRAEQPSPEMVQLYNLALHQQEQLKQQQAAWEDLQLDNRLNAAKQKYGNFDENSVLQWMLYLKTEDPEVAINRMIAEAWRQQGATMSQRPAQVSQPVAQPVVQTPVAPHVESGKRGRGVAASAKKQAGPPQVYNSYTDAAQQILQAGIF